ncbi:MAG: ribonuclease T2 [Okeania sp. SIO2G4]|uniref:ribonuclease T2 n=1 Tax=unclassified Okeania TaxID=2634635 RepID=UPI0013BBE90F|nr:MULTISPECIES: ribonuclease T2 [unclassified Okeania]NEP74192.1 ribonuclease T2 [Okeania sp. SIO2G5]NEP95069.1 ribonuclease T2 [Okeania sp. SIO2F5]NEQ92884.1 ribonuclease T2 [Okeania sp. SIO2G4]
MRLIIAFLLSFLLLGQNPAFAFYQIDGDFTINNNCEAYTSFRKKTGPVTLETGKVYPVLGLNKETGNYLNIKVDGQTKWVNKSCGEFNPDGQSISEAEGDDTETLTGQSCPIERCIDKYVLAISWQPSFCQTKQSKPECISQTADRYDATNFTLHGLWPDRASYCGVSYEDKSNDKQGEWDDLPPLDLDEQTTSELAVLMPGVQSYLHRHEWIKHGTCDGRDEDTYYDISLDLLREVNDSEVQELFAENIGKIITRSQIDTAFENSFGEGAAKSVKVKCRDGLFSEFQIKMRRPLVGDKLTDILLPTKRGFCDDVLVDAAGF